MAEPDLYIGLMSGTSVDGVDAVLAQCNTKTRIHNHCHIPFDNALKDSIIRLNQVSENEVTHMCQCEYQLTGYYTQAADTLLQNSPFQSQQIRAIGMHGQTIRHKPEDHYTLQIGNAALLAENTGIDVVADFRSRDLAASGQGAPLTPLFHQHLWHKGTQRAVLNLGGFANVTLLPAQHNQAVIGFDTGPGNILLDSWIDAQKGQAYDDAGQWAASGQCDKHLLDRLLLHPFFALQPPKSTGRDDFHLQWLHNQLQDTTIAPENVQATLLELTAHSVSQQLLYAGYGQCQIIVCGGGSRNTALLERLQQLLPKSQIITSDILGIEPTLIEAAAFAWLAMRCLHKQAGNLPKVTGAHGERILGAIYQA